MFLLELCDKVGWERPFTVIGVMLILVGIALIVVPMVVKLIPALELRRIPWFLLYVYRREGFFFATSPILIIIGILYFLWTLFHARV